MKQSMSWFAGTRGISVWMLLFSLMGPQSSAAVKTYPLSTVGTNLQLTMTMDSTTNTIEMEFYGPIGYWIAIGFDAHNNGDCVIYTTGWGGGDTAGAKLDWKMFGKKESNIQSDSSQDWTALDISQVNGKQKVHAQRALNTGDSNDKVFSYATNSYSLWVAYDNQMSLSYHGSTAWRRTITFQEGSVATPAPTPAPTTTAPTTALPTVYIPPSATVKTFPLTTVGTGISLAMRKYQSTSLFEMELYGPIGYWIGVAFDSHNSGDSFIFTTGWSGADAAGSNLDWKLFGERDADIVMDAQQHWNVIDISQVNGEQKVVAQRAFNTGDSNDKIIDFNTNTMDLLIAAHTSLQMAYHGGLAWLTTAVFQAGTDVTPSPTPNPTSAAPTTALPTVYIPPSATVKTFPLTTVGTGISLAMRKYQTTNIFEMELYGPIGYWIGVAFDSHNGGDSFIFTTGWSGADSAGSNLDWKLFGERDSDIIQDAQQNWNVMDISQVNGKQKVVAQRAFNTGDSDDKIIDFDTNTMDLLIAAHTSLQMAYHGGLAWLTTAVFQAGTDVTSSPTPSPTTAAPTTALPTVYIPPSATVKTFPLTTVGTGISLAMRKYQTTGIFEMELYGPIGYWIGVAFDSHNSGDSFIFTTGWSGTDSAGSNLDWKLFGERDSDIVMDAQQNWNVMDISQVNGKQKVVAQRAFNTGDSNDKVIDFNTNTMDLLIAAHTSLQMAYHGGLAWWTTAVFQAGTDVTTSPTPNPTTAAPITARPTMYIAPNITSKTFPKTEIAGSGIHVAITMDKTEQTFEVEMHGPIGKWFGIAFGTHHDGDSLIYTTGTSGLDTAGQEPDYILKGLTDNTIHKDAQQDWNVVQVSQVDGLQTMVAQRALDTGDANEDHVMDYTSNTMDILLATADTNTLVFGYHGQTTWSAIIDFESGTSATTTTTSTSTTVRPTHHISENVTIKTFPVAEIGYDSGVLVGITMYQLEAMLELELYGPADRWFGIGFDSHYTGDTLVFTTNYDGTDTAGISPDYVLHGVVASSVTQDLNQNWNVTELSIVDGKQHIVARRAFDTGDAENDYILDYDSNTLHVLVAHASSASLQFDYHGVYCWATTIDFESGTSLEPVPTTTIITTETDDDGEDVDEKVFELAEIKDSTRTSGIFIGASMRKSTDTYTLIVHGPSDQWFGVLWDDHYAGDAFIWTNDGEPDYKCSGKEAEHLVKDTIQSWTIVDNVEEDGLRKITATRALDSQDLEHDYPFYFDKKRQYVMVAYSSDTSFDLIAHGVNRWSTVLDFESGELVQIDTMLNPFSTLNHAIFMMVGFGFLIPFGIFLMRFKLIFARCILQYVTMPISRYSLLLGTVVVFIGFIEKIVLISSTNSTFSYHSYGGFALVTVWMLFIVAYFVRTHKDKRDSLLLLNGFVSLFFVAVGFAQIASGIVFSGANVVYWYAFAIYAAVFIVIYGVLEIYLGFAKDRLLQDQANNSELMLMEIHYNTHRDTEEVGGGQPVILP